MSIADCALNTAVRGPWGMMQAGRVCLFLLMAALAVTAACSVNPVTGKREFTLVSEASEIQMGAESYLPMQQSQGGQYDIDPVLTEYVASVGNRLAVVSDRRLPY